LSSVDIASIYRPYGFVVFRTPLLPYQTFLSLTSPTPRDGEDDAALDRWLANDAAAVHDRLVQLASDPVVREAIFVASPSLHTALEPWLAGKMGESSSRVDLSLMRYAARMSARPTPFGLFAGCSLGELGEHTDLRLAPRSAYRQAVRLDTQVLATILEAIVEAPDLRGSLRYITTPSLYANGSRLRYARIPLSKPVAFSLVDAKPTRALREVLDAALDAKHPAELATMLCSTLSNVTPDAAAVFVDALVDHGLLVPALLPRVTGETPAREIVDAFRGAPGLARQAEALAVAIAATDAASNADVGAAYSHYARAHEAIDGLGLELPVPSRVQVDLTKPLERGTLGEGPANELLRVAQLLCRLGAEPRRGSPLAGFRERFVARYDQREVPLTVALDEDSGVGFDDREAESHVTLLQDLPFGAGNEAPSARTFGTYDERLASKLQEALRSGRQWIEISEADFATSATSATSATNVPLPDAFVGMATLIGASGEDVDAGRFELFSPTFISPSGAGLVGRFCHCDPELERRVRAQLELEDELAGDVILADVVHLSIGRLANVMLRPQLRRYEIVCHGRSGAPRDRQIPIADLLVSVSRGRVVLRSRRLGKRVVPRFTNMHFALGDSTAVVYRFLYELQRSESSIPGGFSWGALAQSAYLPRVRSGRSILRPAMWSLSRAELASFVKAAGAGRVRELDRLRDARGLPDVIAVEDMDNVLPLDLRSAPAIEILAQLARERTRLVLIEPAFSVGAPAVVGPEGRFMNEIAIPFVRRRAHDVVDVRMPTPTPAVDPTHRNVVPGGDVLYAKIYTGQASIDAILRDVVRPVVAEAQASQASVGWFYVRYRERGDHLRVRFFGPPHRLWSEVLPALRARLEPLLVDEHVWKLEIDTYEREIERYGGPTGMIIAEKIFHADSDACLELLTLLANDEDETQRWRAVAASWNALLGDVGLDVAAKLAFVSEAAENLQAEFSVGKEFQHKLGQKARTLVRLLEPVLEGPPDDDPWAVSVRTILARRSGRIASILDEAGTGAADVVRDRTVLWSYLHMHANRMFPASARAQELVVHDLLARAYRARLHRARRDPSS
jgi:thiopeptide-type bacteriocin biosynthesis protein